MIIFCKKDNKGFVAIIAQKGLEVMSMELMVLAMKAKVGNPLRKLVLIKLADNANDQGECWPSYGNIAEHCETTKRSAMAHVKALEEAGFLYREYRKGEKGNKSNLFHLTLTGGENRSLPPSENNSPPSEGDSLPLVKIIHPEPVSIESVNESLRDITHNSVDAESQNSVPVAKQKKSRSKKTSAPENFEITPELIDWASEKQITVDLQSETENFLDHHRAKGSTMSDWTAAWRTWMRNSQKWAKPVYNKPVNQQGSSLNDIDWDDTSWGQDLGL